jgi:hypothetical protein
MELSTLSQKCKLQGQNIISSSFLHVDGKSPLSPFLKTQNPRNQKPPPNGKRTPPQCGSQCSCMPRSWSVQRLEKRSLNQEANNDTSIWPMKLSVYVSVRPYVHLSVRPPVCLFTRARAGFGADTIIDAQSMCARACACPPLASHLIHRQPARHCRPAAFRGVRHGSCHGVCHGVGIHAAQARLPRAQPKLPCQRRCGLSHASWNLMKEHRPHTDHPHVLETFLDALSLPNVASSVLPMSRPCSMACRSWMPKR